jgi:hypothetical protein
MYNINLATGEPMGPAKSESAPESVGDESVGATFSVGAGPAVIGVVSTACAVAGGGPESRDKFGEKSAGVELAACRSRQLENCAANQELLRLHAEENLQCHVDLTDFPRKAAAVGHKM